MPLYCYADRFLHSDLAIDELPQPAAPAPTPRADFIVTTLTRAPAEPAATDWIHRWAGDGEQGSDATLALARTGDGFLLRFADLADFTVIGRGAEIGVWPAPTTTAETLKHLLLDQVLPRVLAQEGRLVLHASAVRAHDAIVAFLGGSGSGKSTLAASLGAAGFDALADDGLIAEPGDARPTGLPTYAGLRLWPASVDALIRDRRVLSPMAHYSSKKRVAANGGRVPRRLPLAAVFLLAAPVAAYGPGEPGISVAPVSPRDACLALITHSFRLDMGDAGQTSAHFDLASRVAAQVPVFTVSYPRDFSRLGDVRAAVLSAAGPSPAL
jgi:hypothetical protein